MERIETAVEIEAPPERVWSVFSDFEAWPEWNPLIPRMEVVDGKGEVEVGARLEVRIEPPGAHGMTFRPRVVTLEPGRRLEWLGRFAMPRLFDGLHAFAVEPAGDGRTRFRHTEEFRGLLVPLLAGTLERLDEGFEAMNRALKDRVEASVDHADTE